MPPSPDTGYERSDASPATIAGAASVLLVVVGVVLTSLALAFQGATRDRAKAPDRTLPPSPRLQVDDTLEPAAALRAAHEHLSSSGWADQPGGAVHIPIADAMRLTAERGIASWPTKSR